eukprot:8929881-Pyramimonas_sp.AAC.2
MPAALSRPPRHLVRHVISSATSSRPPRHLVRHVELYMYTCVACSSSSGVLCSVPFPLLAQEDP